MVFPFTTIAIFYEKMRWLDTRKMPQRSSQVTIENTLWRPPSFFLAGLKGQQLTGYYHPVEGYKSIFVITENQKIFFFFQVQMCYKMRICNLFPFLQSFGNNNLTESGL